MQMPHEIAIGDGTAQRLHLAVGSSVEIAIGGRVHALKVAALYKSDGQHLAARVSFMLPSGQLKDEQATWYGGAHIDTKAGRDDGAGSFRGLSHGDCHQHC